MYTSIDMKSNINLLVCNVSTLQIKLCNIWTTKRALINISNVKSWIVQLRVPLLTLVTFKINEVKIAYGFTD